MQSFRDFLPGFNFDNCVRNAALPELAIEPPDIEILSSTLAALVFQDGVIIGADSRSTIGSIVLKKDCKKIQSLSDRIYCCGAGVAADVEMVTRLIAANMTLHQLRLGDRAIRVITPVWHLKNLLYRYNGQLKANFLIGGVDVTGAYVYTIQMHGYCSSLQYASAGSGGVAAMSALENGWQPKMRENSAKALIFKAIAEGMADDLRSGSYIDLYIIRKDAVEHLRYEQDTIETESVTTESESSHASLATEVLSTDIEVMGKELGTDADESLLSQEPSCSKYVQNLRTRKFP